MRPQPDERIEGRVVGLFRYPVSSLAGERLEWAELDADGVIGDRSHGLFDRETGEHIYPARDARWNAAATLFARLSHGVLELSIDEADWVPASEPVMLAKVGDILGRPVDLRAYGVGTAEPRYRVAPIHLLSVQALDALRRILPASLLDERRFRPNILVDLPGTPGDVPEFALLGQEFDIGGLRLRGTEPCARCGFTTLRIGELPDDPAVLKTLVRRFERNFGIYCEVPAGGELRVGAGLSAEATREASIEPVLIVGAGQAGAMAARALRRLGYEGRIELFGAERHPPYERPPLSKRIGSDTPPPHVPVLDAREAEKLAVSLHPGTSIDSVDLSTRRVETADGMQVGFGTLILATGGFARRLPGLDRGHGRVHVLRTVEDAERLAVALRPGARLFVLGGGWIGMEIAAAARQAGSDVTLFARGRGLASSLLPAAVSGYLEKMHRDAGVTLRFGTDPRFRETADGVACTIGSETLAADHLLVAIGMIPNDALARRAGLECSEGVATDADGATSVSGVYAIGDVAQPPGGRIESWQNANLQAERAARRILGLETLSSEPPRFWSEQYGRRLQIVGLPTADATLVEEDRGPFWDFGTFAIGFDTPERIHRYARSMRTNAPIAAPVAAAEVERRSYPLCRSDMVAEGALLRVDHPVGGPLAVTRQGARVYATDDRCPHAVASLAEGFVADGRIVCPLHFAEFGLEDGVPHNAPMDCGLLAVHPVVERDGELFVSLPA